jgi:erythromycin esterase
MTTMRDLAFPLRSPKDLDPLLEAIGSRPYVAIGEASHGTQDYHHWRCALAKRLIQEKDFGFIVVEWDWPDCYRLNQYVKGLSDVPIKELFLEIHRWPDWMWCHSEAMDLIAWLRQYNQNRPFSERIGFYGFDLFSLQKILSFLINYFAQTDRPDLAEQLHHMYGSCLSSENNEQHLTDSCRRDIVKLRNEIPTSSDDTSILQRPLPSDLANSLAEELRYQQQMLDSSSVAELEDLLSAIISLDLLENAQQYYHIITQPGGESESWNLRDQHMKKTFDRLVNFYSQNYGSDKGIILGHNTHIGDARFTNMPQTGMLNLAQLLREDYGDDIYLVGFATYSGTVLAGVEWNGPSRRMPVPLAQPQSWDEQLHQKLGQDSLIIFKADFGPLPIPSDLRGVRGQRVIGATYNPQYDGQQYVPTQLAQRYDALIYLERTQAIQPLDFIDLNRRS